MKKILIAKLNLEKTYSGASRHVHEEARFLKEKGYEVHIIAEALNIPDIKASGGIPHKAKRYFWQKKSARRKQFNKQVLKLAERLNVDLIIGHGDFQQPDIHFIHNCVHLASEKIHGRPLAEDDELYQTHTPILKNHTYKHIVANSKMMKNELVQRFNVASEDISIIYPAIDEQQFKRVSTQERQTIRSKLGVQDDEFLVGLVTSGAFKKRGIDRFFKAIDLLAPELAEKTHFVYVGKDNLTPEYQAMLDQSPYAHRIRHLPISNEVQDYFNALDIFVLPARIEEFGRVVAEAMACGAPVITTQWVGASELISGEAADFIYEGSDNQELANLMTTLLEDEALRQRVSLANQESVKQVYESRLRDQFETVLNTFLR
ncbi:glycosyltransferase family 4 protein [Marinomonas ostreistagni]|uniref:glycosyltransferase family 4 protein n=1 Tax=Marinomonas ostreistagni TaxID=359209 RepID=UPI00194FCEF8|nr:glycosyltransferase family 4 protein [Marinomonas ostreistagni]MBM6550732.1 glycosyltransferase family 4 protein [Marinomonas ostreistagni]